MPSDFRLSGRSAIYVKAARLRKNIIHGLKRFVTSAPADLPEALRVNALAEE